VSVTVANWAVAIRFLTPDVRRCPAAAVESSAKTHTPPIWCTAEAAEATAGQPIFS
jgi:hypothetical protein